MVTIIRVDLCVHIGLCGYIGLVGNHAESTQLIYERLVLRNQFRV